MAPSKLPQPRLGQLHKSVGYVPGLIGRIATLHADYYSKHWQFGRYFEAKVATELARFLERYDPAKDGIWSFAEHGSTEAAIAIDGTSEAEGIAHLRWFIVSDQLRGVGAGNRLLKDALSFCRGNELNNVYLSTFRGLDSARHLYEKYGFELVDECRGEQWGAATIEQRFELDLSVA